MRMPEGRSSLFQGRCLLLLGLAHAHRRATTIPSCDGDFGSSATALPIPSADISWSMKHYLDCTHRAVWMTGTTPSAGFEYYVGVGIPPTERHASLRADAVVIGASLPALTAAELAAIPDAVKADEAFVPNGYLHASPADQSSCAHLDDVMRDASTVRDGRCDFYEPYGDTHSWRVLDADKNALPVSGETFYTVVWFQEHTSGKIGIAMGNWVENFWMPFDLAEPDCSRDLDDFSEKLGGDYAAALPVATCDGTDIAVVGDASESCELGATCDDCEAYEMMMGCGGAECPAAAELWDGINMGMHEAMALDFSGDPSLDFVRGMIPHHQGAVDMCDALLKNLTCVTNDDDLDGLVMFCNEVHYSQDIEIAGMRRWLDARGEDEAASCDGDPAATSDGCGAIAANASAASVEANREMHAGMAVDVGCDHAVDFSRMMIPHHSGAVRMCEILLEHEPDVDDYLENLCANISRTQRAEVAWLYYWLEGRGLDIAAPCEACDDDPGQPERPCEDMLSSSLLCSVRRDAVSCDCAVLTSQRACDDVLEETQTLVSAECERSCGLCPDEHAPLFFDACPNGADDDGGHHHHHHHADDDDDVADVADVSGAAAASLARGAALAALLLIAR